MLKKVNTNTDNFAEISIHASDADHLKPTLSCPKKIIPTNTQLLLVYNMDYSKTLNNF